MFFYSGDFQRICIQCSALGVRSTSTFAGYTCLITVATAIKSYTQQQRQLEQQKCRKNG